MAALACIVIDCRRKNGEQQMGGFAPRLYVGRDVFSVRVHRPSPLSRLYMQLCSLLATSPTPVTCIYLGRQSR